MGRRRRALRTKSLATPPVAELFHDIPLWSGCPSLVKPRTVGPLSARIVPALWRPATLPGRPPYDAPLAQLVEQGTFNPKVQGSIP